MLKELDPYTVFYHESNMEDYRLMTTGEYGGIGASGNDMDLWYNPQYGTNIHIGLSFRLN